jgi:hypothetical protein
MVTWQRIGTVTGNITIVTGTDSTLVIARLHHKLTKIKV